MSLHGSGVVTVELNSFLEWHPRFGDKLLKILIVGVGVNLCYLELEVICMLEVGINLYYLELELICIPWNRS